MPRRNGTGIALLADPVRRQIIAILAIRPTRPSRLAARLSMSPSAVARHVRLLEDAGLIWRHDLPGDGRAVFYTISPRRHGAITAWLAGTEVGLLESGMEGLEDEAGGPRPPGAGVSRSFTPTRTNEDW